MAVARTGEGGSDPYRPLGLHTSRPGAIGAVYSTFANKWKFEQMEISCFGLQLNREQMEISVISCQMRPFFTILLQLVREQMEI